MYKVQLENGYYVFKLDELLKSKNISINNLMENTNTDFKVIKRLMTGNIIKIDLFVIGRICNYLKCSINDIIEYKQ